MEDAVTADIVRVSGLELRVVFDVVMYVWQLTSPTSHVSVQTCVYNSIRCALMRAPTITRNATRKVRPAVYIYATRHCTCTCADNDYSEDSFVRVLQFLSHFCLLTNWTVAVNSSHCPVLNDNTCNYRSRHVDGSIINLLMLFCLKLKHTILYTFVLYVMCSSGVILPSINKQTNVLSISKYLYYYVNHTFDVTMGSPCTSV